jgi:hypothetical protein
MFCRWFTNAESGGGADMAIPDLGARSTSSMESSYPGGNGFGYSAQTSFGYDPSFGDDEPPLLEELGVDFGDIWSKTKLVLRPSVAEIDERLVEDADLAGPIVFMFALGAMLMLHGKLHFGYVYGFGLSSCVCMYVLLNLMSTSGVDLDFSAVVSFLGYCLLPVIGLAASALIVNMASTAGHVLAAFTVLACTGTSTRLFEAKLHMRHQRFLIAYPLALIYSCFVLITIF